MQAWHWRDQAARILLWLVALAWLTACGAAGSPVQTIGAPTTAVGTASATVPTRTQIPAMTSAPTETSQPSRRASSTPNAASPQPTVSEPANTPTALPTQSPIAHIAAGQQLMITLIHMVDSDNGWAIARDAAATEHLVRTLDGGASWRDVSPPETNFVAPPGSSLPSNSLDDFLDTNTAWITYWSGSDQLNPVWRTHDGGQTWVPSSPIPPLPFDPGVPTQLTFVDVQTGWLMVVLNPCGTGGCSDDILYSTADGGQTWQPVGRTFQGGLSTCFKSGLAFASAQTGWVAGDCSMALVYLLQRTDDGGRTWQALTLPPPPGEPNLLEFTQSAGCKASGPVFSSIKAGLLDMYCPWPKDYPVRHWLYFTTDGGRTWSPREAPTPLGAADFINADTGWWLSGNEPSSPGPIRLYRTTDAGRTWTLLKQLAWSGSMDFISPQVGWAVARAGDLVALVKTVDGGRTWQVLEPQSR